MNEILMPAELTDEIELSYDLLRSDCGLVDLNGKLGLLEVRGDDRKAWLQGQVTNDMRPLQIGGASSFCVLQPTGQIIAIIDAWRFEDRYLLTVNGAFLEPLKARLEGAIIMEDVQIADLTEEFSFFSIQGPSATRKLSDLVTLPTLDAGICEFGKNEITALRSNRTGLGGWDILVHRSSKAAVKHLQKEFASVSTEAHNIARLEAGIPVQGVDTTEKTLPPELGSAFVNRHISFGKGCYTGQEVIMRIHSRGHTNKCWVGLFAEAPLTAGMALRQPGRQEVGIVTSAADSPNYGFIGAGFVRNEAAFDAEELEAVGPDGPILCEVRLMPLLRME